MDNLIYILVTLFSTFAGSISGMGGGVIFKPVFDMLGGYTASQISVLTCSTVLAMSAVSVGISAKKFAAEKQYTGTVLSVAAGSLFGGFAGDSVFSALTANVNDNAVKTIQNAVLLAFVVMIVFYMRGSKKTLNSSSRLAGLPTGFALGIISAFLGIGGGPINVAVLTFVFGFGIKTAVLCSLTSVLVAQAAKFASIIIHSGTSPFAIKLLPFMVAAGVAGAITGRAVNKKLSDRAVNNVYTSIQVIVIAMCIINIIRFTVI